MDYCGRFNKICNSAASAFMIIGGNKMVKITESERLCEMINKMLNNGKRIQLEYNHQNDTVKLFDCTPKIVKINDENSLTK